MANGPPVFAERAAGATLTDLDGHDFIDFAGGIGTLNVGHAHPEVVAAVRAQAERHSHTCFNIVMYPGYIELAEALIDLVPGDWPKKVMLQTTGAEAVENAIKVRRATGRQAGGGGVRERVSWPHLHGAVADREGAGLQERLRSLRERGVPGAVSRALSLRPDRRSLRAGRL